MNELFPLTTIITIAIAWILWLIFKLTVSYQTPPTKRQTTFGFVAITIGAWIIGKMLDYLLIFIVKLFV